jgi:dUTP pyrophosphatase
MPVSLTIVRVRSESVVPIPRYQTQLASGLDLHADIVQPIILQPMERRLIPSGFIFEIPAGYEGQVRARSGLALKHGLTCLNAPGTIDADYRGEVSVLLVNLSTESYTVQPHDRIAQLVIAPVVQVTLSESPTVSTSERGIGGFGSTGG